MRNTLKKAIGAALVFALLGGVAVPSQNAQAKAKKVSMTKKVTVNVGRTAKIKLKHNKKKAKWKITKGKKLIQMTKKKKTSATIKGLKKGTAKVQAVVGKKKYNCTVTVSAAKKKPTASSKPQVAKTPVPTKAPSGGTPATLTPVGTPAGSMPATLAPMPTLPPNPHTIVYDGTNGVEIKNAEGPVDVVVKDGVTEIRKYAFNGCSSLTSITIPDSVKEINSSAFNGCSSLETIQVSDGNTVYDSRDNCNAIIETKSNTLRVGCKNTTIPDSVKKIGGGCIFRMQQPDEYHDPGQCDEYLG